jgi:serine/threonine-protein kinase
VDAVDHRSDQWSMSCIVWRMLVGQQPFVGPDVNTILHQVMNGEPPPLGREAGRLLPGDVEPVLRRALSKRQQDRFPTITAFARSFEAAAGQHAKEAVPPRETRQTPAPRAAARKKGGRLWTFVVVAFGIALVVGGAVIVQLGKLPFMGSPSAPEPRTTETPSASGPTVIPLHTRPRGKGTEQRHGR